MNRRRFTTECLGILAAVVFAAAPARAQPTADGLRPVIVQGAMQIEVEQLAGRLDNVSIDRVGAWTF